MNEEQTRLPVIIWVSKLMTRPPWRVARPQQCGRAPQNRACGSSPHTAQASLEGARADFPRRREDPLPQTPYVALDLRPVNRPPLQGLAVGSVRPRRSRGVQLVPWFPRRCHRVSTGSPDPRGRPFGPGHQVPYPASSQGAAAGRSGQVPPVPAAFRRTGIRLLGHPAPAGALRLPHGQPTESPRTPSGLPRCPRARSDRGGCPLYSGGAVPTRPAQALQPSLAASQRPTPVPRYCFHLPRAWDNGASSRVHSRSPVRSSPMPVPPGGTGALGRLLRASHPAVTSDACRSGDEHSGTCPESRHRHQPASPTHPLATRTLVSHACQPIIPDPIGPGPALPCRSAPTS